MTRANSHTQAVSKTRGVHRPPVLPIKYSHASGVQRTRVGVSEVPGLSALREAHKKPVIVAMTPAEYHGAEKKTRTAVKRELPYIVGGEIEGKRHDSTVLSRTLATLDIEAQEGQDPPPDPASIVETAKSLGAEVWVHTSISSTEENPRYRVLAPLGKPIEGGDLHTGALEATTKAIAAKLGLSEWCAPESYVLSQAMFLPARLKGGHFWEGYTDGKPWRTVHGKQAEKPKASKATKDAPADMPDGRIDPVITALKRAGLYLNEDPKHKGKHFITCPFAHEHDNENETQTVYYEAHHDGNPRPAVKCFDTAPDKDGQPHLTFTTLVRTLREGGHLDATEESKDTAGVLEDFDVFDELANVGQYLNQEPVEREWAIEKIAPIGKVSFFAGPGGVSKSMMLLHLMVYGSLGISWGPFNFPKPLRSLYASYEDDRQELHKRVHGLMKAMKSMDNGLGEILYDVEGSMSENLRLFAADDDAVSWLLMTKPDQRSGPERTARVEWLVGYLKHARMRLLVIDPAVYTHGLEESAPGEMAAYMQTLTYIAKTANVAVVVLHHMHKTALWASLDDIHAGSLRGASSLADNSRSVCVLVNVPNKDALRINTGSADVALSDIVVLKHVKHNYSASMGTHLFQRQGPLLVPLSDANLLPMGEARALQDVAAQARKRALNDEQALRVLVHLQQNPGDTTNMVGLALGLNARGQKEALETCEKQGFVEKKEGPGNSKLWTVTSEGKAWLRAKNREAKHA
jgi:RecA-family ATPase